MGFLDLFKPKWKHSDEAVRKEAVRKLENQDSLIWVAKNDKEWGIRKEALGKLENQKILEEIAKNDERSLAQK